ncbi:hypothetical protein FOA19_00575 [Rufibacter hautae]|uniref:Uncharacterized protein n=1 Tax=Rufibacter hautae TaxID=2595005 RepID=A0A5B6TIL6_9BACT|nr:hypothetical protein FOA19_00575 [Rufibacter hautae]
MGADQKFIGCLPCFVNGVAVPGLFSKKKLKTKWHILPVTTGKMGLENHPRKAPEVFASFKACFRKNRLERE